MQLSEFVTDEKWKITLEQKARRDADLGHYLLPHENITGAYQHQARLEGENQVYYNAYHSRRLRNARNAV